eukprot:10992027-Lingulodinium_polyedra.AAC.1
MAARAHWASAKGWNPANDALRALSSSSTAFRSVNSSARGTRPRAGGTTGCAAWRGCWQRRQWVRLAQLPSHPQPAHVQSGWRPLAAGPPA